mgnify:CR=1 FL=1
MAGAVAQYLQFILLNWFIFTVSRVVGSGNKRVHTSRILVHLPENVAGTAKYIVQAKPPLRGGLACLSMTNVESSSSSNSNSA